MWRRQPASVFHFPTFSRQPTTRAFIDMYPQLQIFQMDTEAISGVLGSISVACWVTVFSPQIIENFRRASAEGLSLAFLIVWLLGDLCNVAGAIFQGVLPTMLILAIYYTGADLILIIQMLYYQKVQKAQKQSSNATVPDEGSRLISHMASASPARFSPSPAADGESQGPFPGSVDAAHLSPTTPVHSQEHTQALPEPARSPSALQAALFNASALALVCAAGAFGWWITASRTGSRYGSDPRFAAFSFDTSNDQGRSIGAELVLDPLGQAFGYLCAVLYLASRVPQLLLNYRRASTDGLNILFFLFACVGNLTYVLSILAYEPPCARAPRYSEPMAQSSPSQVGCGGDEWSKEYGRYMLVNLSWLIGSAGTLLLDLGIFSQFWHYRS